MAIPSAVAPERRARQPEGTSGSSGAFPGEGKRRGGDSGRTGEGTKQGAMSRPILVTGCPRSGLGHVASLLERLDVPCGRSGLFNAQSLEFGVPKWPRERTAEASWEAAPYAEHLTSGTVVVHVVRHPLPVLDSLWRARVFRSRSDARSFIERHATVLTHGLPVDQTARLWSEWNELAESARDAGGVRYVRVRVEALDETALRWIGELSERDFRRDDVKRALESTVRSSSTELALGDWTSLRGTETLSRIDELAARYGYGRSALGGLLAHAA